ncbi:MAG: N-acetyl-gamma-glutamyl-phosphate reductase, partial [SAR324 cluster bacterium]|nr:N-acetyl-gamma-glutamyl-phosphate reductase [SAR324 cluster bacterium]
MINVGILGAGGLSGLELIHWLSHHPEVKITVATSSVYANQPVKKLFPRFTGQDLVFNPHDASVDACDVVFLAVPNEASLARTPELIAQGKKVIDLSGVFRIKNTKVFEQAYKLEHTAPELLEEAVFGLPEYYAESIKNARLIANPGCYPTGSLLGLLPFGKLLENLKESPIIDAKSGVSGAGGRAENSTTNYVTVNENFKTYKVFGHQHQPEIQQYLEFLTPYRSASMGELIFTPHLLPLNRGILSTIYLRFTQAVSKEEVYSGFEALASKNPFVNFLGKETPDLQMVQNTNHCFIGAVP